MSSLIWKGNSYTLWTVSGVKPCLKILASAVGGTKEFFNSKLYTYFVEMVSSFFSFSGHGAREDLQILTSKKLI